MDVWCLFLLACRSCGWTCWFIFLEVRLVRNNEGQHCTFSKLVFQHMDYHALLNVKIPGSYGLLAPNVLFLFLERY